jgi:lipase
MGSFVALVAAHLYPDRFREVLLIDGGLRLAVPAGISMQERPEATLGPAIHQLSMTFPDRATFLEFWTGLPAFADQRGDALRSLADYSN